MDGNWLLILAATIVSVLVVTQTVNGQSVAGYSDQPTFQSTCGLEPICMASQDKGDQVGLFQKWLSDPRQMSEDQLGQAGLTFGATNQTQFVCVLDIKKCNESSGVLAAMENWGRGILNLALMFSPAPASHDVQVDNALCLQAITNRDSLVTSVGMCSRWDTIQLPAMQEAIAILVQNLDKSLDSQPLSASDCHRQTLRQEMTVTTPPGNHTYHIFLPYPGTIEFRPSTIIHHQANC